MKMSLDNNKYSNMQRDIYQKYGAKWSLDNKDEIVGPFDLHNNWADYDLLFKDIPDLQDKICLDFGCGPGRSLVKYAPLFRRIHGVDISQVLLNKAKEWIEYNGLDVDLFELYISNGYDLQLIGPNLYDVVMSTICLQHICVHEIRLNLFKEFYRVLNDGGYFTAQMGFGSPSPLTVPYNANYYDAIETNRACDTAIENEEQLKNDLYSIGFKDFNFYVRPVGPGDLHPNWIFFNVRK